MTASLLTLGGREKRATRQIGSARRPFAYHRGSWNFFMGSFAALSMNADLGFDSAVFGLGAGIFFIGYFIFEVPSNLALEKMGARVWIARIMLTWGLVSAAMALVWNDTSFYAGRFLLGAAEAGFFPGVVL